MVWNAEEFISSMTGAWGGKVRGRGKSPVKKKKKQYGISKTAAVNIV